MLLFGSYYMYFEVAARVRQKQNKDDEYVRAKIFLKKQPAS